MTVAVAIVTWNDEPTIGRCLTSLRDVVDEIIVVATGETDATTSVAARFTERVFDLAAGDDLAAMRQFALDRATADWVMWVEPDDVVLQADRIRPLLMGAAADVGAFAWRHVLARDPSGHATREAWPVRCVRNDGSFRWHGGILPTLVSDRAWQTGTSDAVVVERRPASPAHAAGEEARTRRRLDAEYAAGKAAADPNLLFQLAHATAEAGDAARAVELYREVLAVGGDDDAPYLAHTRIAASLRSRSDHDAAIDADFQALKLQPGWPDAYFGLAASFYYRMEWAKVVHWIELARELPVPRTPLVVDPRVYAHSWLIHYTNALYRTGDLNGARAFSQLALDQSPDDGWHRANLEFFERLIDFDAGARNGRHDPATEVPTFVVIPVHDRHDYTRTLLRQLALPPERAFVIDNNSTVPAREALAGLARIVEYGPRNISEMWNLGLELAAAECAGPHNVAVLNNDVEVPPGFLAILGAGLRAEPDILLAYPDEDLMLPPGVADPLGRMCGHAFLLRGEAGLRADPQFIWWAGDDDLQAQAWQRGRTVRVGGIRTRHLEADLARRGSPELTATSMEDWDRFVAKWGRPPG